MPDDRPILEDTRVKVIVPIPMDGAGVANRAGQLVPDFVARGFQPEFAAVLWGAALGDSYHDMLLMDWTVFQAGIDARAQLIDFATQNYFANVDAKNIDATLACFHDEALFCAQTAFTRHSGKAELRRMFEDFFDARQTIVHRDFTCTVDEKNGRIAASFDAVLTGHDGGVRRLSNTNFWRLREGRFQEVYVYMSGENPLV